MHEKTAETNLARYIRNRLGQSQEQVAKACGFERHLLIRFEQDELNVSLDFLQRLAKYYNVTLDELLYNRFDRVLADPDWRSIPCHRLAPEPDYTITGTEYFRRLAGLSRRELARLAGVCEPVIHDMCIGRRELKRKLWIYMRVANALGVTVGQLVKHYEGNVLDEGGYGFFPSKRECPKNSIAVYRRRMGLTYEELGRRMGNRSKERARQVCAESMPNRKYVKILAEFEGLTTAEFYRIFFGQG